MKKGQTQMVFIFILAAIVIGLIVILGYKGITSLTDGSEKIMIENFVNDLKDDINGLERLKGSVKTKSYTIPTSVRKVCFVRSCSLKQSNCPSGMVPSSLDNFPEDSLLLLGADDTVQRSERFGKVLIEGELGDETSFCIINKGKIKVKLIGLGDGVTISEI